MATSGSNTETSSDESLYPIAVLIDELRNEDVQVSSDISMDLKPADDNHVIIVTTYNLYLAC